MSKALVKIIVNDKDFCTKKLNLKETLNEIRKKIKYENNTNILFMNGDSPISLEDEKEITVEDILKNKNLYLKGGALKLYINNQFITNIEMSKEEPLKLIIEKYSGIIPQDFDFIDKEQMAIKKEDAINDEEILIEDILNDDKICIVSKSDNINKKVISNNNNINTESNENPEQKITVNIYVNNEAKTIKKLNENSKLSEVRKILSDIMSENAYFAKGEIKIDENDFLLKEIIQDNSIFIIDNSFDQKEKNKEEKSFGNKSNEEYKVMSIIENGKVIKSKKINIKEPLSELRSQLELPMNASFLNDGADIDIKDESIFNISDIIKEDSIYIKREESKQYTIYYNNQILTKQNLEPSKDLASLRNLLSLQINDKAYFINANTKEKINIEEEEFLLLSKISNNNNEIFIEQEVEIKKKVTELIKGSELLTTKGQLKIYKYNCMPQQYVDKLIEQKKINNYGDYNGEIFDMNDEAESKTIIVLGQTGSGKTTLLNSLVNFILGVEFEDDFRYIIIDEKNVQGNNNKVDQTKSVTQNTTIYYIKKYKDFPSIILIDTPGFGDTSGPDKDKIIIEDIKNTFEKKLTKIDAICFVAQSSNVRLTANQNYIFSSVMSLFGKDIAENFIPMLTFCDANDPQILDSLVAEDSIFIPILNAIKKYDPWYLKFNNSAIFTSSISQFNKLFWDLGMASFKVFIEKIKNLPQKSLDSSKNVLRARQSIEEDILHFKKKLDEGLLIMQEIEKTRAEVEKNEKKIKDNQNFTYKVTVTKFRKIDLQPGIYTTNCMTCNRTCHKNCVFSDDNEKRDCCAIDSETGKCKRCDGHCDWTNHKNLPYIFEYYEEEEEKTYDNLKKEFLDSKSKVPAFQQILQGLETKYDNKFIDCFEICEKLNRSVNELKRIALNANANQRTEEYINLLIENEKRTQSQGWVERNTKLEEIKKYHHMIAGLISGKDLMENLKNYRKKTLKERELLKKELKNKDSSCQIF
jgi:tRNA A37 threonylcarbamoyladenosine biosynthesis protein TsaE